MYRKVKNLENNKKIADLIIESLKTENLTTKELETRIGKSEQLIRNALNQNLKKKGIVVETGEFKQQYKVYRLNRDKIINDKENLEDLIKLKKIMEDKMEFNDTTDDNDRKFLEYLAKKLEKKEI